MNLFLDAWSYAFEHCSNVAVALRGHLLLVALPMAIGLLVGLPLRSA